MIDNQKKDLQKLVDGLSQNSNIFTKRKNQVITTDGFSERNVIIFHHGIISLYRLNDDRLLYNFIAPKIIGLNLYMDATFTYYRACTEVSYEFLPLTAALRIIEEKNLWKEAALNQMAITAQAFKYLNNMTGVSSYALILNCLYQLQAEPDVIRLRRTAADYIVDKSGLSRSTVMKSLAKLRSDGNVILSKGLLMDIRELD